MLQTKWLSVLSVLITKQTNVFVDFNKNLIVIGDWYHVIYVIFGSIRHWVRVCWHTLCVEMEISGKRIKVLKNDSSSVLFWKTNDCTKGGSVQLFCLSSNMVHLSVIVCVTLCKLHISFIYLQACWGGGEVFRPASTPSAHLPGQTNHRQRDGAGEDEEGRATDAATKPCSGDTSGAQHGKHCGFVICRTAYKQC